jgi:crotonobetainyl-CoA:carnitine CoA-transferase CaiB-like acyl-CoA transferase
MARRESGAASPAPRKRRHVADTPLAGIRVLDFTRALAGPHGTFILAALGATVIKVEEPGVGDRARSNPPFFGPDGPVLVRTKEEEISFDVINRARGKRSITLNLKHPEAIEIVKQLARESDVVIENFSAGVADRLGFGYESLRAVRPDLIYCAMSGFGADQAPGLKAMDAVIQGMSGSAMTTGTPEDGPIPVGWAIADVTTPLFAVIGILAALERRRRTGEGDFVDVSMLGSLTSLVATENWEAWRQLGVQTRNGRRLPRLAPFGQFACKDGYFSLGAGSNPPAFTLFRLMGRADLIEDERYASVGARMKRDAEIAEMIEQWAAQFTPDEVVAILNGAGIAAAPVRMPLDAVNGDIVSQRGETIPTVHPDLGELAGYRTAGVPIVFKNAGLDYSRPAPHLGEHTDAILADDLHLDPARIRALHDAGAL